jgi:4-hydroxyphenylpyruvate dioxygenase-like putative hemolysin
MARIIEFRTVNIAVPDWEQAAEAFAKMGIPSAEPHVFEQPPAQMVDVAFRLPGGGGWSLISPIGEDGPVSGFLKRRGPSIYSMTVRVDNLAEAMTQWTANGLEWARPEPAMFPDAHVPPFHVERLLMNWIKPSSLNGILVEVVEFAGAVTNTANEQVDGQRG